MRLKELVNNQKFAFWTLITVLMITSVVLLFTEPMNISGKIVNILFPLGLQIVLFSLTRRPGIIFLILIPKLFFDGFQYALIDLYGGSIIGSDMFLNLVTTSASEAGEVLASLTGTLILVLLIYIPAIILAVKSAKSKKRLDFQWRKKVMKCGGVILAASLICLIFAYKGNSISKSESKASVIKAEATYNNYNLAGYIHRQFHFTDDVYPINVIYNLGYAVKKWNKVKEYARTSKGFKFNAVKNTTLKGEREIYVLVLGETSRAASWSLYGYSRRTSPFADSLSDVSNSAIGGASNLLVFKDFITQSNTTHKSVPIILSPAEAENYNILYKSKSIITAFKEAGFRTIFIKNQNYDKSIVNSYYNEADEKMSVSSTIRVTHDEEILPLLKESLAKNVTDNLFIIIHLYGSHFAYHNRYPKQFAAYTPDKPRAISKKYKQELVNSYDNSIINTDYVTYKIIETIKAQNAKSVVMCLADHGEDLMDDRRGRFLHASLNATYYQMHIPFYIWFSDNYVNNYRDKYKESLEHTGNQLSTNAVFHSMLDYASVHTKYLDSTLCIGSAKLVEKERTYLTDHDKPVKLGELPLTKYDYEQFAARGLKIR